MCVSLCSLMTSSRLINSSFENIAVKFWVEKQPFCVNLCHPVMNILGC